MIMTPDLLLIIAALLTSPTSWLYIFPCVLTLCFFFTFSLTLVLSFELLFALQLILFPPCPLNHSVWTFPFSYFLPITFRVRFILTICLDFCITISDFCVTFFNYQFSVFISPLASQLAFFSCTLLPTITFFPSLTHYFNIMLFVLLYCFLPATFQFYIIRCICIPSDILLILLLCI